jgi:hypothetical protein
MFTDPRTWSTMLYQVLMLPLGILYFTVAVTLLSVCAGLIAGSLSLGLEGLGLHVFDNHWYVGGLAWWAMPFCFAAGVLGFFGTLHLARGIGYVHGNLAKHLLVKTAQH